MDTNDKPKVDDASVKPDAPKIVDVAKPGDVITATAAPTDAIDTVPAESVTAEPSQEGQDANPVADVSIPSEVAEPSDEPGPSSDEPAAQTEVPPVVIDEGGVVTAAPEAPAEEAPQPATDHVATGPEPTDASEKPVAEAPAVSEAPVEAAPAVAESPAAVPPVESDQAESAPVPEVTSDTHENPMAIAAHPAAAHKAPVGVIAAAVAVAVVLAVVAVVFYMKSQNKTSSSKAGTAKVQTSNPAQTATVSKATPADVTQASSDVDSALNALNDTSDFSSNAISDSSLGL